jgi:hypothetical protein
MPKPLAKAHVNRFRNSIHNPAIDTLTLGPGAGVSTTTPAVVVEITLAPDPSPIQKAKWAALWQRLLTRNEDEKSRAPAVLGTGLDGGRAADAPMDLPGAMIEGARGD